MRLLPEFGVCDCHSHVFGPYDRFPLAVNRTYDPPEAPLAALQAVWTQLGIDRAVLVQGSAHGSDHRALLAALAQSPQTRRGVAVLEAGVAEEELLTLHRAGVRAVRFNWVPHLLRKDSRDEAQRLADAAALLRRVQPLGWHAELHLDLLEIDLLDRLDVPGGMDVVVDHMARLDASHAVHAQVERLLRCLETPHRWTKLSGADRISSRSQSGLRAALQPLRTLLGTAAAHCVWGLDWPHVNQQQRPEDLALAELLLEAADGDAARLRQVLVANPAHLYGFPQSGHYPTHI
ncbi:MAG: amidohydrolase family protein [Acidobacteriota bacterium]|nr:amidohydrolase family protein [Acidobacteriota bacterium]